MRFVGVSCVLLSALCAAGLPAFAGDWRHEDQRTLSDTLAFEPGGRVVVDNIFGSITVRGGADEVRYTAHETISADSAEDLAEARQEVELAVIREGDTLELIVDGPFRREDGSIRWNHNDYVVAYEIELQVPRLTDLVVKTVNEGEISVTGVEGDFEVRNVNGGIEMKDVAGGGKVTTVNGPIDLQFARNPVDAWSLKTINGNLDASFEPGLSADFRFKTFNGDVWSDFDAEPRALEPVQKAGRKGARFVYKSDRSFGVRVSGGGPELAFDTLNGNIYIRRAR